MVPAVNASPPPARPGRRSLILLIAVLGGVCTIGPFSTDLYLPAMPSVAADLHASAQSIELTITAVLVGLALGQLFVGPLSDVFGRRRPLLAGLAVFTASSLVCALAPSAGVLIAARAIEGLAGACGLAIANAVVTDHFRDREAARFLSRLVLVSGMAPIVAPLIGGQLLRLTSWRGIFVVLTAIGVVLIAGVAFGLRESLPPERRSARGLSGALHTMGMLSRDRAFMSLAVTSALAYAAFFAYLSASSFVTQKIYDATPVVFSILFSINAVGMLVASQANGLLLARRSPRLLLAAGLCAAGLAGVTLLGVTAIGGLGLVALVAPLFVLVASLGFIMPDSTALALSLHPDVAGSASAYFGTLRLALGALATPLVGVGGGVSAMPMAIVIAVSTIAALLVFFGVARRTTMAAPLSVAAPSSGDIPVG
jgi:DHA1 family bicyclomycin/chloramphenicol resistance-like MFS transporter